MSSIKTMRPFVDAKLAMVAMALVFAFSGCQNDLIDSAISKKSDVIRFSPKVARIETTRTVSGVLEGELSAGDASMTLPMTCQVSEGIGQYAVAGRTTRGHLINNNEKPERQNIPFDTESCFYANAWTFGAEATDFDYTKVLCFGEGNDAYWITVDGSDQEKEYKWKAGESKVLFGYANLSEGASVTSTLEDKVPTQTLSVTALPGVSGGQKDMLLGYFTNGEDEMSSDALVDMLFYHPMTAVLFKKGSFEGTDATIASIAIEGVYGAGTATMDTISMKKTDHAEKIVWSDCSGTQTVALSSVELSNDTIGDAFLLIPQTFASSNEARIAVTLSTGVTLYQALAGTEWKAGCTYAYTIGYTVYNYTYTFELAANGQDDTTAVIRPTTDAQEMSLAVTSSVLVNAAEGTAPVWTIKSVQVGDNAAEDINADNCTKGGLTIAKDGNNLKITAAARTAANPGSHEYWINSETRTDCLAWSPENWTSSTASAPIDLSTFDAYTDTKEAHSMTTANCYIIRHAGTYMLPLVYGNAVIDGEVNEQAYKPTMAEGGEETYFLANFVNHKGAGITSAFIENNTGCVAVTADIVWQDKAAVITGLSIADGASAGSAGSYDAGSVRYLKFTVDENTICQNNAVIAIKDGEGKIIWSWHIWTTNDPALLTNPISVTNYSDVEYDFLPLYNLGWIDKSAYISRDDVKIILAQKKSNNEIEITVNQPSVLKERSNGCWYQFGRKDPMCSTDAPVVSAGFSKFDDNSKTLDYAIANPGHFLKDHPWYYNLWTGRLAVASFVEQDNSTMIKTIYDPSPVEYKMPASKAFTGFTTTGNDGAGFADFNVKEASAGDYVYGWNFYTCKSNMVDENSTATIFFPESGYRHYENGEIGNDGNYWTAVPVSVGNGYNLGFISTNVWNKGENSQLFGFSVRPVKEK